MSFARHNRGRPLFSHAEIVSAREQQLLAENQHLREKNRRLSTAILTLVDRIETKLPYLDGRTPIFEQKRTATEENRAKKPAFKDRRQHREYTARPKMEVYETYHEPIEFADPAPQMHFGPATRTTPQTKKPTAANDQMEEPTEFVISPELAPEEIDLLKSPTRDRPRQKPVKRETVDVVDLHPKKKSADDAAEAYEAGEASSSEIPQFEFADDEPAIDIEFERKETLRAAMRRRVNRLRW